MPNDETKLEGQDKEAVQYTGELLDEKQSKETLEYFEAELLASESEREPYMARVDKWRRQREAVPEQATRNFPWPKASNVVIPLAKTNTNSISASMKASFSQKHPFFHIQAHKEGQNKTADYLSKYLDLLVENKFHLNLRANLNEILFDLVSLGTEFVSVPWIEDVMNFKRKDPSGMLEEVSVTRKRGPAILPIRIEDFYTREYFNDIQTAPWVAIAHNLSWHELKQRENQGVYNNIEEIKSFYQTEQEDNLIEESKRIGFDPGMAEIYKIFECYRFMDIDNDGIPEDVKIWFERGSKIIVRVELNDLGVRPIVRIPYISYPKKLYGEGIGWMCEHLQDAIDALFNMAVNSTNVSSLQMFATKRNSGIGPKEEFRPLKQFEVDNPREDIVPIAFPNTIGPNLTMIQFLMQFADKVTGATNAMVGFPDTHAKTRATASGTMFLAQQSSRLFNSIVENVEEGFSQIGALIVFQLVRHKDKLDLDLLGEEARPALEEALSIKVEDIHMNFAFSISSAKVDETEEAKRQSILTLTQLYSMYGQQNMGMLTSMIQVALQLQDQKSAMQFAQKYFEYGQQLMLGSEKLMTKVLDFFSEDKEGYLPYLKDIEMMLELMNAMKDQQLGGMLNGQRQVTNSGGIQGAEQGAGAGFGGPVGGQGPERSVPNPAQQAVEPGIGVM